MYVISNNIRVKTCDDLSFLVNISDNSIFCVKTSAFDFLVKELNKNLTLDNLVNYQEDFICFVSYLEKNRVLEVI